MCTGVEQGLGPLFAQTDETRPSSYWKGHTLEHVPSVIQDRGYAVLYLRVIGVISAMSSSVLTTLSLTGIMRWPIYLISACIATSTASVWILYKIGQNHENQELEEARKITRNFTLVQLAEHWGWEALFTKGILTSNEFAAAYRAQMQSFTITEICAYFEQTCQHLSRCKKPKYAYFIPKPSEFRDKWHAETAGISFVDIIEKYPIDKLKYYKILSRNELSLLERLTSIYETAKRERGDGNIQSIIKDLNFQYKSLR